MKKRERKIKEHEDRLRMRKLKRIR